MTDWIEKMAGDIHVMDLETWDALMAVVRAVARGHGPVPEPGCEICRAFDALRGKIAHDIYDFTIPILDTGVNEPPPIPEELVGEGKMAYDGAYIMYQCSICGEWFRRSDPQVSCLVLHPPGTSCHYHEMPLGPPGLA